MIQWTHEQAHSFLTCYQPGDLVSLHGTCLWKLSNLDFVHNSDSVKLLHFIAQLFACCLNCTKFTDGSYFHSFQHYRTDTLHALTSKFSSAVTKKGRVTLMNISVRETQQILFNIFTPSNKNSTSASMYIQTYLWIWQKLTQKYMSLGILFYQDEFT